MLNYVSESFINKFLRKFSVIIKNSFWVLSHISTKFASVLLVLIKQKRDNDLKLKSVKIDIDLHFVSYSSRFA